MPDNHDDADYLNALEFVENLPPQARACRGGRNHNFLDGEQLFGDASNGVVHTEIACARGCKVIKVEDFDLNRGYYIKRPHYRYPEGYLIKEKETGPIHPTDLGAAIRLIRFYERRGTQLPNVVRMPRRKRKGA